jgi:hypothetical protein
MTSSNFYERFNDQAYEFMKELSELFPQVGEFNRFKSALNVLRNLNTKTPQNFFNKYIVSSYRNVLLEKDENFFLNEKQFGIKDDNAQYWFEFIEKLQEIWKTLDPENKEIIWRYFKVLVLLSDKCMSLPNSTFV